MNIKLSTFDRNQIANYMMSDSTILNKGIVYAKFLNPSISNEVAQITAIRLAQDYCYNIWRNDSTGYIDSEYRAWTEFVEKVNKNQYFYNSKIKAQEKKLKAQKEAEETKRRQESNEIARVAKLKEYCKTNGLSFEEENIKQLKKLNKKQNICGTIAALTFILGVICLGIAIFKEGDTTIWLLPTAIFAIIFFISAGCIPDLPSDVYDVLKKK